MNVSNLNAARLARVLSRLEEVHRQQDPPYVTDVKLGDAAVRLGWLNGQQLREALDEQAKLRAQGKPVRLGQVLLRRHYVTPTRLVDLLKLLRSESSSKTAAETMGRYQIIREIGRGGMGRVYAAQDPLFKRHVAVKILDSAADPSRLQREALATSRLQHPNIVKLLDGGQHEGRSFLVMELVEGHTLQAAWKTWPLSERIESLERLARAVGHAHNQGVVHRDLKPANVMVTPQGQLKVMDFGLALIRGESRLTLEGSILGTPAYMAPEQILGEEVTPATDVYSLGIMLYEAMTGTLPFTGDRPQEAMRKTLLQSPPPPRQVRPEIPQVLEAICLRAIQKEPSLRYPSADAFADALATSSKKALPARGRLSRWLQALFHLCLRQR